MKKSSQMKSSIENEDRKLAYAYALCIISLIPLNIAYFVTMAFNPSDASCMIFNSIFPLYFMISLAFLGFRVLDLMVDSIWTAAFWFPIQSFLLFGFGPLVETYGNAWTRDALAEGALSITALDLLRSNALSTLGVTLVLFGFCTHIFIRKASWNAHNHEFMPAVDPDRVGFSLVIWGAALKYLIIKPQQWGMINIVVPGFVSQMGSIVDIGFAILAMSEKRNARLLLFSLWPIHLFLCILSFSKSEVIFTILMVLIGSYVRHGNKKKLFTGAVAISITFMTAQPWISYGRNVAAARTGNIDTVNYVERLGILTDYITTDIFEQNSSKDGDVQNWWQRLSYAGPQAHAMDLYDRGYSGSSLNDAWIYFIPRWIWLDKPILTGPALEYYRLVTGNPQGESFLGLSVYGDLYWQFGWIGVLIGCPLIGWLFAMLNARSIRTMREREYVMFPLVLIALQIALQGPSEFVVSGIIGPLPIYMAYYIAILVWVASLRRRQSAIKSGTRVFAGRDR